MEIHIGEATARLIVDHLTKTAMTHFGSANAKASGFPHPQTIYQWYQTEDGITACTRVERHYYCIDVRDASGATIRFTLR